MMKKIFSVIAVLLASAGVFANSEEAAVKQVLTDSYKFIRAMDVRGVLTLCHPEYVEIAADGEKFTYSSLQEMIPEYENMRKAILKGTVPGAGLLDVICAIAVLEDEQVTDDIVKICREMGNTPDGKKMLEEAQKALSAMHKEYLAYMDKESRSVKIQSVNVEKESAVLIFTAIGADSGKMEETTLKMVKVDGKWLIKESISKYMEK